MPARARASATRPAWRARRARVDRHLPSNRDASPTRSTRDRALGVRDALGPATPARWRPGTRPPPPSGARLLRPPGRRPGARARVAVPNRPVWSPRSRSSSAAPASTSPTWRSSGPRHARRARSRCGSRATEAGRAAEELIDGSASRWPRRVSSDVRPLRPRCAATLTPAGRQVDLPPRRAVRGDDRRAGPDPELPRRRRHELHARRAAAWARASNEPPRPALVIRGVGAAQRPSRRRPIDVGNAGTLMRLLPGWLAGQQGGSSTLDGDESIRRRPVDRVAGPLRADGRADRGARRPVPAVDGGRRAAHAASSTSCRWPARRSNRACCWPGWWPTARRSIEPVPTPGPHRAHAARAETRAARRSRDGGVRTTVGNVDELEIAEIDVPGDLSSAAFLIAAGVLVPGSRAAARGGGTNWTRRVPADPRADGRRSSLATSRSRRRVRRRGAGRRLDVRAGAGGHGSSAEEVPLAIDELPLVALLGCFAEGETVVRGAERAAPQGVRPDRDGRRGPARARRRHRGDARRVRGATAPAACAAACSTPTATTGWRCSGPSPGWRPGGRGGRRHGGGGRSYPASRTTSDGWLQ